MLIVGLVVAAILGPLYVWQNTQNPTIRRYGIGSAVAVLGVLGWFALGGDDEPSIGDSGVPAVVDRSTRPAPRPPPVTETVSPEDILASARDAALLQLGKKGLPTSKDEDWKYTDLDAVIKISNEWLTAGATVAPVADTRVDSVTALFDLDWLIIRNGTIDADSVASGSVGTNAS